MPITRLRGNLQLKQDTVTSDRIKDLTITEIDIAPGSLDGDVFADGSIPQSKLEPGSGGTPAGTNGNLQYALSGAFGADSLLSWDSAAKDLGVGRTTGFLASGPYGLEVRGQMVSVGDAGAGAFSTIRSLGYNGSTPVFSFFHANGTEALPTNSLDGDVIGFLGAKGFDGADFSLTGSRAAILMLAAEDFTPTAQGTFTRFRGTLPGTVSNKIFADFGPYDVRFYDSPRVTTGDNVDRFLAIENSVSTWLLVTENTTGRFHITENDGAGIFRPFTIEKLAPDNALYVSSVGNVGIGTATPATRLNVSGSGDPIAYVIGASSSSLRITNTAAPAVNNVAEIQFAAMDNGSVGAAISANLTNGVTNQQNYLYFSTRQSAGDTFLTPRMLIDAYGNVGIGDFSSISADTRLHVLGNVAIVDGTQAEGKTLTSNAAGHSSWIDPAVVLARIVTDGENVLVDDDGNVIFTELS